MQWAAMSAPQARSARAARDDRLRPDRVGRGREQPPLVQRMQAREGAEARSRARRLGGRAEPLDDPSAVASETPAAAYVRSSLTRSIYEVGRVSGEQLAVQLRAAPAGRRG